MAFLTDIGTSGFAGVAPTPTQQRAINHYLVNDQLMNIMGFQNIGMGTNTGNIQGNFVYFDSENSADFRKIGEEYAENTSEPKTESVVLKNLGGMFHADKALTRAFNGASEAVSNWVEEQTRQKINGITNSFAKYFITGKASTNIKQFDGLDVFFGKFGEQVNTTPFKLVGGVSQDNHLRLERFLIETSSTVNKGQPNCILTTTKGKAILQSGNTFAHRGIEAIGIRSVKYNMYMDMPIIALPDSNFASTDIAKGIPVIFLWINEDSGITTFVPIDGGIVDIQMPNFNSGRLVEPGSVEMICAPAFKSKYCASKCYIVETEATTTTV